MNIAPLNSPFRCLILGVGLALFTTHSSVALAPYVVDENTVYLYHLDEASGNTLASNLGSAATNGIAYNGTVITNNVAQPVSTTVLGGLAYADFGNAATVATNNLGLGVDANSDGVFVPAGTVGTPVAPDFVTLGSFMGTGNSFTLEAMISLASLTGTNREIIATDNSAGSRGFQFRVNSTGNLEFNFISTAGSQFLAPIPTTGDNAFAPNTWFHVALTFDGTGVTPQTTMYWTLVDPSRTEAAVLATTAAVTVNNAVISPLVLGNEGRINGNSSEGLLGSIDEVRISNVARGPGDFIFSSVPEPSTVVLFGAGGFALLMVRGLRHRKGRRI